MTQKKPIFQAVFGDAWVNMPRVLQRRYANCSESDDEVVVQGQLEVYRSRWIKILTPLLRLCGALVPYSGHADPVTVRLASELTGDRLHFQRSFHFAKHPNVRFFSSMSPWKEDQVVEWMRFGLGWLMRCHYDGEKVRLDHLGYIWRLFSFNIPVPIEWILGQAYADEQAIDDHHFAMSFAIIHPWFGKVFGYHGLFQIVKDC